jgi:hypothetical protein
VFRIQIHIIRIRIQNMSFYDKNPPKCIFPDVQALGEAFSPPESSSCIKLLHFFLIYTILEWVDSDLDPDSQQGSTVQFFLYIFLAHQSVLATPLLMPPIFFFFFYR